ncbi:hypothetical protein ACFL43_04060 [Thermodesulfobacteriota bacterium]
MDKQNLIKIILHTISNNNIDQLSQFQSLGDLFNCLRSTKTIKIITVLSYLKIATAYELKKHSNIISRDTIIYHIDRLTNYGLVDKIGPGTQNYQIYNGFWEEAHPTSHDNPPFYLTTPLLDSLAKSFEGIITDIFNPSIITILKNKGDYFTKHYNFQIRKLMDLEKTRELDALTSIGACKKCSKLLKKDDIKNKRCEFIKKDIYCKKCVRELMREGTLSLMMKQK